MATTLEYTEFNSPLRFHFKHSSADRKTAQSIIVKLTDNDGITGHGEGCPRVYVTGETNESALAFINTYGPEITQNIKTLQSLKNWIKTHHSLIDKNPAAFCAIEIALLDLMARQRHVSIENFLGVPEFTQPIEYTAVIGDSSPLKMKLIIAAYQLYGFKSFKLKLSGNLERDNKRLATLPRGASIRLDANNHWHSANDCINHMAKLNRSAWAIEEPTEAFSYDAMKEISASLGISVILDESLYTQDHLDTALNSTFPYIANIRISKCGGILRSIELANRCVDQGIEVILGAHVGETSLLTRGAIAVGQGMKQQPIAREGAYGKILLKSDISRNSLIFGKNGLINNHKSLARNAHGLGLLFDQ